MGLGMWMTSCPEAMGRGFWVIFEKKKAVSWDLNLDETSWFFGPGRGQSSGVYETRRALLGQMEQSA